MLGTSLIDGSGTIAEGHVLNACGQQKLGDGDSRRACAVHSHLDFFLLLSHQTQGIGQACQSNDSRSMLIIMENGNIALLFQLLLDLETAGSGDILQIHAAAAAGNHIYGIHNLVYILALDAQRECVHIAKLLEQDTFAFHNRHTCLRTDIAQTQDCGSVCHYQTGVPAVRVYIGLLHILLNLQTGLCYARCISQGKILFGLHLHS